jgi:hypothetical protein
MLCSRSQIREQSFVSVYDIISVGIDNTVLWISGFILYKGNSLRLQIFHLDYPGVEPGSPR